MGADHFLIYMRLRAATGVVLTQGQGLPERAPHFLDYPNEQAPRPVRCVSGGHEQTELLDFQIIFRERN